MLTATGYSLLATLVLGALLWLVMRAYAALRRRVHAYVQRRAERLAPSWSRQVVGQTGLANLAVMPLRLLAWSIVLLLAYQWAALVLEFFPYTRPWREALRQPPGGARRHRPRRRADAIPGCCSCP